MVSLFRGAAAALFVLGVSQAPAIAQCTGTSYTVSPTAPASANWTDTTVWIPAGFPGSGPCDTATNTTTTTTLTIDSALPNPVAGLTWSASGAVIDIESGGQLPLAGPGTIGNGATLQIAAGNMSVNAVTLQNSGSISLTSVGSITLANGATLTNTSTGTIDLSGGGITSTGSGPNTVSNGGTLTKNGSSVDGIQAVFDNSGSGSVTVNSGTLQLTGGGTGDAPFTVIGDGVLEFPVGSYVMKPNGVISGSGTLAVTGGTLTIGGVTEPGGFHMTAGTLDGAGFLSVGSSMTWSGGTITGTGGAELAGNANGVIDGSNTGMVLDQRTFNVYGHMIYSATTNPLQMQNDATLAIFGTFDIQGDGSITCNCSAPAPHVTVDPNGTLFKSSGSATFTLAPPLTNSANVFVFGNAGTLLISGSGTHTGFFSVDTGSTLAFNAASTTFDLFSFIGGNGTVAFTGGSTSITGFYGVGSTSISGGTVNLNSAQTMQTGDFFLGGGATFTLQTAATMSGTGTWSCGTINGGTGSFDVLSGATMTIDAATGSPTLDGTLLVNHGTIYYTANPLSGNVLTLKNAAEIDNHGLFDIQTDAQVSSLGTVIIIGDEAKKPAATRTRTPRLRPSVMWIAGADTFENYSDGTFQKSAGSGTANFGPEFENDGAVKSLSGKIDFTGMFTQDGGSTSLAGGDLIFGFAAALNGGKFDGNGTITGDINNGAGMITPGSGIGSIGTINLTGNYAEVAAPTSVTSSSGAAINIELAGDTSFDQFAIGGTATLAGSFTATLVGAYAPANGVTWPVVTYASHTGSFGAENLPTYGAHGSIVSSYTPTAYNLTAVVTPSSADIKLAMNGPASVNAGASLSYTIDISNLSGDPTNGVFSVVNTLPGGVSGASASGTGWTCGAPVGSTINCTNSTALSVGQSLPTLTVTMTAPSSGGSITNSATVTSPISDPTPGNNTGSVTTNVVAQADLSVTKTKNGLPSVAPGQNITYTIAVSNAGPSTAVNVVVNDSDPPGLTFVSNGGACTTPYPCSLGNFTAGQSASITTTYSVPAGYSNPSITNTATVGSTTSDPNPSDNSSTVTTPVTTSAILTVVKSGPATATRGSNINYTVTVSNSGTAAASNVTVSDTTPAGLTFVSNTGACTSAYPCNVGTLNPGGSATIQSTYAIPPTFPGTSVTNTASVGGGNSSTVTTTILSGVGLPVDLSLTKTGPVSAAPGSTIDFQILVKNNSLNDAANVVVTDPTPAGLQFVANFGACTTPSPCTIGTMPAGETAAVTARYLVIATDGSTVTNTATVSTDNPDTQPGNDSSSAFVSIASCPSQSPTLTAPATGAIVSSPVTLTWSAVPGAASYTITIQSGNQTTTRNTNGTSTTVDLGNGTYTWFVQAVGQAGCNPVSSTTSTFTICSQPPAPLASVIGASTTGQTYEVSWIALSNVSSYELQEATDGTFANATSFTVNGAAKSFTKNAQTPTPFFYRVRAITACDPTTAPFSPPISVVVLPLPDPHDPNIGLNVPDGSHDPVTFQLFVPGLPSGTTSFVATVDKPWLAVAPSSGLIPPEGLNLTVSADPSSLTNGTWTGTVIVAYGSVGVNNRFEANASATTKSVPVSISLVTPVTPKAPTTPVTGALVIPSVGHLPGVSSNWRSDIRVANVSPQRQQYQLTFNGGASNVGGYLKQTTISIDPGATTALDDIVRNWYGIGAMGDSSNGVLSIAAIGGGQAASSIPTTLASSRTYNASAAGTLGQFIPAIPFANFIGATPGGVSILSLQQLAQTSTFRTNLGLVEANNKPVNAVVTVFDGSGTKLLTLPVVLNAGEQRQINSFLSQNGLPSISNARVEVSVSSGEGAVTAYASVIDDGTTDPLLVSGTPLGGLGSSRFVVPGIASLDTGGANWRSDLRIFNSGTVPQNTTLTFFPTGNSAAAVAKQLVINPGEVKPLDDVVPSLFGLSNVGGAVHVTTPTDAPLVVTARTFDQTSKGTLGQFIPAVTLRDTVGNGDRSLQILQVEESVRFRTNLGIAEVNGKPATVEITVALPDSKVSPKVQIPMAAFESKQIPILSSLGLGATYNARISVRVVGGDGKVTAYGSVIDQLTQDPTYVPAQ